MPKIKNKFLLMMPLDRNVRGVSIPNPVNLEMTSDNLIKEFDSAQEAKQYVEDSIQELDIGTYYIAESRTGNVVYATRVYPLI